MNLMLGFNPFDIYGSILNIIWTVFVQGPLLIINCFNNVLYYLAGGVVNDLMFGGNKTFSFDNVPRAFYIFLVISAVFFVIIYLIQLIIIQFKSTAETKVKILKCLQSSLLAWLYIFLIPIGFYLLNSVIMILAQAIIGAFSNSNNIASYLYHAGDPNWNGTTAATPSNFSAPTNIKEWNIFSAVVGACFMLYVCCMIGMLLVQKIIELFFLFVISPMIMTAIVLDDGKAASLWKDMVIAKFLASTAAIIGFFVFAAALQAIAKSGLKGLSADGFTRQFFFLVFSMGGGMACLYFTSMIGDFIGERVGITEARQSFQSVITAGAGLAGTFGAVRGFLGLKTSKRFQGGAPVVGSVGNVMDSTKHLMDNGIKMPPNLMARRSGAIGLVGLAAAGVAAGIGATVAGAKKEWNAGDRSTKAKKLKGFGRVAASPITGTLKSASRFLNPRVITLSRVKTAAVIEQHKTNLFTKMMKHDQKAERLGDKIAKINRNSPESEKQYQKQEKKLYKKTKKIHKLHNELERYGPSKNNFENKKKNK